MMRWYVDGAGWNGTKSRYAFANEQHSFPIVEFETRFTNNQMEYQAMIRALEEAGEGDEICADSELIVNQLNGKYKVKAEKLRPYHIRAKRLIERKDVKIIWVPRKENKAGKMLERT